MKVVVNRTEIDIFVGASVVDALRAYYVKRKLKMPQVFPIVKDRYGNQVAEDGTLSEGSRLIVRFNINK
jgi:hypothetical protein